MAFNDIFFLLVFLPVALLLYVVTPRRLKNVTLVLVSLVFYAWGNPWNLLILVGLTVFNYAAGRELAAWRENPKKAKAAVIATVAGNLLVLGLFKYGGMVWSLSALTMPLGLSFFTFSALSYVFDVYRGKAEAQKNFLSFCLYMTFFPKLISGPIVQYRDMEAQLRERRMTRDKIGEGMNLFLVGLMKKVLLADTLGAAFGEIQALGSLSAGSAWLGLLCYGLQLYFDFSGYSDMAIGLGRVFGFDIAKNFDYPYLSSDISEFWRRWHISLGAWFREYVYIPLGGNRCSKGKQVRNLLAVWVLTGIWHGSTLNFLIWGLYHGVLVLIDKFLLKDAWPRVPKAIRIVCTTLLVLLGWVFFFTPNFSAALSYFGSLFGAGGFLDGAARYYFRGNWILLAAGIFGCFPLAHRLHQSLTYRRGGVNVALSLGAYLFLLLCCIACLVASTYSSFLYAQF